MAIAHVCLQCGWDLARVRAQREPHYGLPLVTCPRCQWHCVRREHPIYKQWKYLRRLDFAMRMIAAQIVAIVVLGAFHIASMFYLMLNALAYQRGFTADDDFTYWTAVILFVLAPITGAWLWAGFRHLKWWHAWLAWMIFVSLGWIIASVSIAMEGGREFNIPRQDPQTWAEVVDRTGQAVKSVYAPGLAALCVMMACAVAGIPLGQAMRRLFAASQRAVWRWRRKRAKLWRSAT